MTSMLARRPRRRFSPLSLPGILPPCLSLPSPPAPTIGLARAWMRLLSLTSRDDEPAAASSLPLSLSGVFKFRRCCCRRFFFAAAGRVPRREREREGCGNDWLLLQAEIRSVMWVLRNLCEPLLCSCVCMSVCASGGSSSLRLRKLFSCGRLCWLGGCYEDYSSGRGLLIS